MTELLLITITSIVAAVLTFYGACSLNFGPVIASAGISLIFTLILRLTGIAGELTDVLIISFFGSSFVGMTSEKRCNIYFVALGGLFFGLIFSISNEFFRGYGGGLGATAFMSVLVSLMLKRLINYL